MNRHILELFRCHSDDDLQQYNNCSVGGPEYTLYNKKGFGRVQV